jgi:hypothetical protein
MIRVVLPYHLRTLAQTGQEVNLQVDGSVTWGAILDELETRYPNLRGTIRDPITKLRRPYLRFFACGMDLSLEPADFMLPDNIRTGAEPFRIVGAMAGG